MLVPPVLWWLADRPNAMLRSLVEEHRLAAFVVIAFGWTWSWDLLYYVLGYWEVLPVTFPRQWGLPIAALVVLWLGDGSPRGWLKRVLTWRIAPIWYVVALLVPLAIGNAEPVARALAGGTLAFEPPASLPLIGLFIVANVVLLGGVEELGWRGFLQPRLQARTSVLTAGLAIGVLWGLWHLPLFLGGKAAYSLDPVRLVTYLSYIVGASTVFGAFVNLTDGGVLPVMVMHAASNVGALLVSTGGPLEDAWWMPLVVGSGLWWLLVVVMVFRNGRSMVPGPPVEPVS